MSIFISYAHEDAEEALTIYELLANRGYSPWIDRKNLLPGQDWELEIDKAIRNSDIFIACLSTNSVSQRGYFLAELRKAINILETVPEEDVFLIPVRLDDCKVPSKIKHLHWLDYFTEDEPSQLIQAISHHLTPLFLPEMILIPAGEFLMGSDPEKDEYVLDNELPQHRVYVPEFYIGKHPITNLQFKAFLVMILPTPYKPFNELRFKQLKEVWRQAKDEIQDADEIVACGFSFRDPHFNQMVRECAHGQSKPLNIKIATKDEKVAKHVQKSYRKANVEIDFIDAWLDGLVTSLGYS